MCAIRVIVDVSEWITLLISILTGHECMISIYKVPIPRSCHISASLHKYSSSIKGYGITCPCWLNSGTCRNFIFSVECTI